MERLIMEAGKMIVDGAGGAVLGSICESFLKSTEQCCTYDYPVLESLKSTVENLMEVIPKMEDHNMKLGDRQDEVKELKEEMKRGARLLEELTDVNELSCFKASYNDQLVEFDASLKSLVSKLRLQSAVDVKEVLVLEKETAELVRSTKRKVDKVDETVTYIQRKQEEMDESVKSILKMMKKQKIDYSANVLKNSPQGSLRLKKQGSKQKMKDDLHTGSSTKAFQDVHRGRADSTPEMPYDYGVGVDRRAQV